MATSIPWAKLATSAPDLVQGARALWGSVRENKRRSAWSMPGCAWC
jgi:hypothetical protein